MVFLNGIRRFMPRLVAALVCAASIFYSVPMVNAATVGEYDLKAALLIKVTAFVTWPDAEIKEAEKEKQPEQACIGILGDDPFGETLDGLVQQTQADSRVSTVRRLTDDTQVSECQVVFVSASRKESVRDIVAKASAGHVLTVGDFAGFAEAGGMVELKLEANRIALRINAKAIEDAGLEISSKLLSLAEIVETKPDSPQ
jgi:hypothetical protein